MEFSTIGKKASPYQNEAVQTERASVVLFVKASIVPRTSMFESFVTISATILGLSA